MDEASDNSLIGTEFDDELFTEYPDRSTSPGVKFENLNFASAEMKSQQAEDPTLVAIWAAVEGKASTVGVGFCKRDGLLYQRWIPPGSNGELFEIEQFFLPTQCRKPVLDLAHNMPLAVHMGKNKKARRVLGRIYWPILYKDVADYCKSCLECQMAAPG